MCRWNSGSPSRIGVTYYRINCFDAFYYVHVTCVCLILRRNCVCRGCSATREALPDRLQVRGGVRWLRWLRHFVSRHWDCGEGKPKFELKTRPRKPEHAEHPELKAKAGKWTNTRYQDKIHDVSCHCIDISSCFSWDMWYVVNWLDSGIFAKCGRVRSFGDWLAVVSFLFSIGSRRKHIWAVPLRHLHKACENALP